MSEGIDETVDLARAVLAVASEEGVTFLAAAVAYYAFVSMVPLALLTVAVATAVGGSAFADAVVSSLGRFLTPEGQDLVREGLRAETGRGPATAVGFVAVFWGGLKLVRGIDRAFSAVYGTTGQQSFLDVLRDATVALLAIGVGVLAVGVVAQAFRRLLPFVPNLVGTVVLLVTLVVALFPLYYVLPDAEVTPGDAFPGAVFAAGGWTLLEVGFRGYVSVVGGSSVYGLLGGAFLLVTWLYFGAIVVLIGAVINATLAGRRETTEDRQLQHPGPRQARPEQMPRREDTGAEEAEGGGSDATEVEGDPPGDEGDHRRGPPRTDGGRPSDGDDTDPEDDSGGSGDGQADPDDDADPVDGDGGADRSADDSGGPRDDPDGGEDDPDWPGSPLEDRDTGDRDTDGGEQDGDGGADDEDGPDGNGSGEEGADPGGPDGDREADRGYRPGPDEDGDGRLSDDDGVSAEFDRLWEELEELETRVDDRTVSRSSLESELRAYVRARLRRGHARGWGPYLVLLYGTAMTLGAFHYLEGIWAILAMIVLWLSTLGLYTLMIIVGVGINLLGLLGKARGLAGGLRSNE